MVEERALFMLSSMQADSTVLAPRYELGSPLASGAEGVLISAVERRQRRRVVIKKRHIASVEAAESCKRELVALTELGDHDNVVTLIEHISSERWEFFVLERMACDLYALITSKDTPGIPEIQARRVLRDVTHAIRYLHAQNFSHNDIKPENILLNFEADQVTVKQAKLTDFGFCMRHDTSGMLTNRGHGTDRYMAPEVWLCCCNTSVNPRPTYDAAAADVFSLGATLFVALVGQFLPRRARLDRVMTALPLSANIRKLTLQMLENNPADRPTIRDVRLTSKQPIDYSIVDLFGGFEEADQVEQQDEDEELNTLTLLSPLKSDGKDAVPCPSPVFDAESSPFK